MFQTLLINSLFRLLDSFLISKITYAPLKKFAENQISPLKKIVGIFADKNPDNDAQLKEFWEANKKAIISQNLDSAIETIKLEVKKEDVRNAIVDLLEGIKAEQAALAFKKAA